MQLSGSNLAFFSKNTTFSGFNQKIKVDTRGDVKTSYIILDSDSMRGQLYQTHTVDLTSGRLRFAGRSIHFPGGSRPPSDSSCWFDKNAICTGGKRVDGCVCFAGYSPNLLSFLHQPSFPTSPVVILRCGGHLHHSGVCRHLHSGCRRIRYKSFYQVQPVNTNRDWREFD